MLVETRNIGSGGCSFEEVGGEDFGINEGKFPDDHAIIKEFH